ncbi:MAG: dihydroorotase family protein [Candidatus Cloacimonetes bacterium]|nr:dihydroorotase family protein [Candidatus Cloacimonadota bacterium]
MKKAEILLQNVEYQETRTNIIIRNGLIESIGSKAEAAKEVIDCQNLWVFPGVIDPHVHMRGLEAAYKEDWHTGSASAIRGGITGVFDMPNTIPATTNQKNLDLKRAEAKDAKINHWFYLGATNKNYGQLQKILENDPEDVIGIKVFLSASSSNEILSNVTVLRKVFELGGTHNKIVTIHTELEKFIVPKYKYAQKIENHNIIRTRKAAITGLEICLQLAKSIGNSINIAHVTTTEEVEMIRAAKAMGEPVYCEVTPHHLLLNEQICNHMGNLAKVNPPLRTAEDNAALWEGISNFTIDMIGSDHAPHTLREKRHAYSTAPSGIPGMDTTMRLMLTCVHQERLSRLRLIDLVSTKAASIFGLGDYGKIKEGNRANLTIIDPEQEGIIKGRRNRSRARYTPFEDYRYKGAPVYTIINGKINEVNR